MKNVCSIDLFYLIFSTENWPEIEILELQKKIVELTKLTNIFYHLVKILKMEIFMEDYHLYTSTGKKKKNQNANFLFYKRSLKSFFSEK